MTRDEQHRINIFELTYRVSTYRGAKLPLLILSLFAPFQQSEVRLLHAHV
jgi:hypothetical protein